MGSKQRIDFSTFAPPAFLGKLVARCAIVEYVCIPIISYGFIWILICIHVGRLMFWSGFYISAPPDVVCIIFQMILVDDNVALPS